MKKQLLDQAMFYEVLAAATLIDRSDEKYMELYDNGFINWRKIPHEGFVIDICDVPIGMTVDRWLQQYDVLGSDPMNYLKSRS